MLKPCIPLCKLLMFWETFRTVSLSENMKGVDICLLQQFQLPSFAAVFVCGIFLSEDILGEAKTNCGLQQLPQLQSYDSSWLSAFISSPSVSFSLLLLLFEVWHPACWPERSSHPWNPYKRDFLEKPSVDVLLSSTPSWPDVLLL